MPSARNYHNVKRGYWNGKWYDSSWELALLVYFHDHNMELTRNTKEFKYFFGRSKRPQWYRPDFILEDGTYVEIKGIKDRRSMAKMNQFPFPIQMWGAREMKPYLDYMKRQYGDDWIDKF